MGVLGGGHSDGSSQGMHVGHALHVVVAAYCSFGSDVRLDCGMLRW